MMKILAIETSCDDTCVAVVEAQGRKRPRFRIVHNIGSSQTEIHRKWGGVVPGLAKREHQKNLPRILKKIQPKWEEINIIAVTVGPGLDPCLWQGIIKAKQLALKYKKKVVGVNHLEGHIFANWLAPINHKPKTESPRPKIEFPILALIVSGGHTQLVLVRDIARFEVIGRSRDDAAGEALDKTARLLGLGFPGGATIAAEAARLKIKDLRLKIKFPRPMINSKDYDFSFSGLKTAVLYDFKKRSKKVRSSADYIRGVCAEVQQAVIDVLIYKTIKAAKDFGVKTVMLAGGVAANKQLRKQFREAIKRELPNTHYLIPNTYLCADNAVMIAIAAYFHALRKDFTEPDQLEAQPHLML